MRHHLKTGHNVDKINVANGLKELTNCGYDSPETVMVIDYCLVRWARGEEVEAQKQAIDKSFHGIEFICWIRVLAAAIELHDTDI
jgi:hypothetical protein